MDPLYISADARGDRCTVAADVSLYYELRGTPDAPHKVVLIMGAFATLRHFEQLADSLAAAGGGHNFQVLTYDHRGIGRSTAPAAGSSQTSEMLAVDAAALVDHVWPASAGNSVNLHIYGASMGGMVAQRLALLLLARPPGASARLRSLALAVTARAYGLARFVPLGAWFYRQVLPLALPSEPGAMVDSLLPKCFSAEFLAEAHPGDAAHATYGALWRRRWIAEYAQWFSFGDLRATAAQATVAGRHYTTDGELTILRDARVPILVAIAERDELMAPAAQRDLADRLRARTIVTPGGHMGSVAEFRAFAGAIASHLLAAAVQALDAGPAPPLAV